MQRKTYIFIDQLYSKVSFLLLVAACLCMFLGGIGLIPAILNQSGIWENSLYDQYYDFMKPVLVILLVAFVAFFLVYILLLPFTTQQKDERDAADAECPLVGLTKEQKKVIVELLKERGKPTDESNKMKRSEVAYILNALMDLGYIPRIKDDFEPLRLWVIKETGYREDDKNHFTESMGRKGNNKTKQIKELIEERLAQVPENKPRFLRFLR